MHLAAGHQLSQLREFGETKRGWLGVRIQDVQPDVAEALGLETAAGALVTEVPEGPAADAGIVSGDVIMTFDGKSVADTRSLVRIVGNTEVGRRVDVEIFRDGKVEVIGVNIGRLENASLAMGTGPSDAPAEPPKDITLIGMTLSPITDELRQEFAIEADMTGVVVIAVDEASLSFEKGIRTGDVISEVAQEKISSPSDIEALFSAASDAGRKSILLLVRRDGQARFVAVNPAG